MRFLPAAAEGSALLFLRKMGGAQQSYVEKAAYLGYNFIKYLA